MRSVSTLTTIGESELAGAIRAELRRAISRSWADEQRLAYADGRREVAAQLTGILEGELSISSLAVPEAFGGGGGTWVEVVATAEELGRATAPARILQSSLVTSLLVSSTADVSAGLVTELTNPETSTALVWPGADSEWRIDDVVATAQPGRRFSGRWSHVPDVTDATVLLVPARIGRETGFAVLRLHDDPSGVTQEMVRSADPFRRLSTVTVADAAGEFHPIHSAETSFRRALCVGSLVIAAEMVGAALNCLDRSVEYTTTRTQFDRRLAEFQVVKHRLADVLVAVEAARALTFRAIGRAPLPHDDGVDDDQFVILARAAKAAAADALYLATTECIQFHGAMGFTWDNPAHLALKRWAGSSKLFGHPDRARLLNARYEVALRQR